MRERITNGSVWALTTDMERIRPCAATIETPRLRLREVEAGDVGALAAMFAARAVMGHYLAFMVPAAAANWVAAHRRIRASTGFAPWTVELHDGTFVGQCGPLPHLIEGKREVEIICFLRRRYWRGGIADEACLASVRYAFERIGVARVIALILPTNRPSKRLAIRCGLKFEGYVNGAGRRINATGDALACNGIRNDLAFALYAVDRAAFFGRLAGRDRCT